jgi:hypothetical protein
LPAGAIVAATTSRYREGWPAARLLIGEAWNVADACSHNPWLQDTLNAYRPRTLHRRPTFRAKLTIRLKLRPSKVERSLRSQAINSLDNNTNSLTADQLLLLCIRDLRCTGLSGCVNFQGAANPPHCGSDVEERPLRMAWMLRPCSEAHMARCSPNSEHRARSTCV